MDIGREIRIYTSEPIRTPISDVAPVESPEWVPAEPIEAPA